MISTMTSLFEGANDIAQIIFALAIFMVPLKGVIWSLRCSKDSPNYINPSFRVKFGRDKSIHD